MPHLLIVDDEDDIRSLIADIAKEHGFTVAQACDTREARLKIDRQKPNVVMLDMQLPDGNGIEFWEQAGLPDAQVVFITGYSSVDSAVQALRCGAIDYLRKPLRLDRLEAILSECKALFADGPVRDANHAFVRMVGDSEPMQMLRRHIERVAPTRATVLLIGESGTGKELAAEALHLASARHKKPFMAVNCGAIAPNLIESELFGHEKGSFTGADRQHKGFFERADGGTLFLDEVTEMPIEQQVRLLRVLETGVFMRVGSQKEMTTDVRVVAATNRDPEEAVEKGVLRADLFHRLSVFPLVLPPLRERGEDTVRLAQYFLDSFNADHGTKKRFGDQALDAIRTHAWPGNIRELRNFVYRSYILADSVLEGDDPLTDSGAAHAAAGKPKISLSVGVPLADANRQLILATLEECGGVKKAAAEMLGISLKALHSRLEEYGDLPDEPAKRV